jgi:hypothetical protein
MQRARAWSAVIVLAASAMACAPPSLDDIVPGPGAAGAPVYETVSAEVTPLAGNAPLRVTVTSSLGAFIAPECDLRVLGVSTGANLAQEAVQVDVDVSASVALVCERGVSVGVDEHLVDLSSIDSFVASPSFVAPGTPLALSWQGAHLSNCSVATDGGKSPIVVDELGARATHVPSGTTTYTLTCDGLGGPISRTLRVEELVVRVAVPPHVPFGGDLLLTVGVPAEASCEVTAQPQLPFAVTTGPVDEDLRIIFIPDVEVPRTYAVACAVGSASASATTTLVDVAPSIRSFDVIDVSASSATLRWSAVGASSCTLDNGTRSIAVPAARAITNPFGEETSIVTYTMHCESPSGLPAQTSVVVAWGDVTSASALFGVRAVMGDVLLASDLPQGALRYDDLKEVVGNLTVRHADGPNALIFVGLSDVGGNVVLEALPHVDRLLLPELARLRSLRIADVPLLTCADVEPVVCGLDGATEAAVDVTPSCACATP